MSNGELSILSPYAHKQQQQKKAFWKIGNLVGTGFWELGRKNDVVLFWLKDIVK